MTRLTSTVFSWYNFAGMLNRLKKLFNKICGKKYYKVGKCLCCGKCCSQIYVKHSKGIIKDEHDFENLKYRHRFYTYLKVTGKDDIGLVFECQKLDKETNKCKIHNTRPAICRRYPQEEMFSMGGDLSEGCGYKLLPVETFEEVLTKIKKHSNDKKTI